MDADVQECAGVVGEDVITHLCPFAANPAASFNGLAINPDCVIAIS